MKEISKSVSGFLGQATPLLVILAVITPFVMVSSFFFPFITGKAFYFRILVELMACTYLIYALFDKSVWPKKSVISITMSIFLIVLGISTLLSTDPLRSFWSNYERMEGYILFLHLGFFFLVASAVMKYSLGWWKWFFRSSLVMSVLIGIDAFRDFYSDPNHVGYRIFGNLGNSSYLGVYALASFFICLFFIVRKLHIKDNHTKDGQWVSFLIYSLIGIFNLVVLFNTGTRGSFIGLVIGLACASVLIVLFEKKNKILRNTGVVLIVIALLFISTLGASKESQFVKKSDMLSRFAELVTFDFKGILENQGKARSLLWNIAWEGVKEKPVFGWGLENFHYVFAEHYTPAMSEQEHWFDRSHNVFMDWMIGAGVVGLLSYLALFGSAGFILWRKREEDLKVPGAMSIAERAVISGGLIAYLCHNIFVFDNLTSYILFFAVLAFLHQYSIRHVKIDNRSTGIQNLWLIICICILVPVLTIYVLYKTEIRPIQANIELIQALRDRRLDSKTNQVVAISPTERFQSLKDSIAMHTMTNSEQIEQLAERGSDIVNSSTISVQDRMNAHAYVVDQFNQAIQRTPKDPRPIFFYAIYLVRIGSLEEASKISAQTLSLSPQKIPFINFQAMIENQLKHNDIFLELASTSHALAPKNEESRNLYIAALAANQRFDEAESLASSTMAVYISDWNIIKSYIENKQSNRIINLIKRQIEAEPNQLDLRSSLAATYARLGNTQAALQELATMKRLAPQFTAQIDKLIADVKNGKFSQ